MENSQQTIRAKCENYGEERTREKLKKGNFSTNEVPIVEEWLREKGKENKSYINRDELDIARESNAIAKWAIVISILSLILSLLVALDII